MENFFRYVKPKIKEATLYYTSLVENMKVLIAIEKKKVTFDVG